MERMQLAYDAVCCTPVSLVTLSLTPAVTCSGRVARDIGLLPSPLHAIAGAVRHLRGVGHHPQQLRAHL